MTSTFHVVPPITHALTDPAHSCSRMAVQKEVLVVFGDRRRAIVFEPSEDRKEERVRLLDAVNVAFSDLLERHNTLPSDEK